MKKRITTYKIAARAHYKSKKVKNAIAKANQARLGLATSTSDPSSGTKVQQTSVPLNEPQTSTHINGSRIINLDQLCESIDILTSHSAECGGKCVIEGETMHSGLAVILQASCTKCHKLFHIRTSPRVQTEKGKKLSVNIGAVLGEMTTGGGLSQLNTTLAMMDVPGMHRKMFTEMEEFIGSEMMEQLSDSMRHAAEEEKENAILSERFHQGVPSITVVVDGGWSKRSHKHSYNAKSGVAVIFGQHTRKLLFLGVRNKFCSVCAIAANKGADIPDYKCYLNWSGSSTSMESDIIAEGIFPFRTHVWSEVHVCYRRWGQFGNGNNSTGCAIWDVR